MRCAIRTKRLRVIHVSSVPNTIRTSVCGVSRWYLILLYHCAAPVYTLNDNCWSQGELYKTRDDPSTSEKEKKRHLVKYEIYYNVVYS